METVACMIGTLLKEALHETVHTAGVPEEAAKAMLFGHVQIALTNALRGSNPFSEACEIAIQYGKDTIIKDDWKKIFDDSELDYVIAKMLKLEARRPALTPNPRPNSPEACEPAGKVRRPRRLPANSRAGAQARWRGAGRVRWCAEPWPGSL